MTPLRRLRKAPLFRFLQRVFDKERVRRLLRRAKAIAKNRLLATKPNHQLGQREIFPTRGGKCLLLVVPFYGDNGSSNYVEYICRDFKASGYEIHTIVYNKGDGHSESRLWDRTYHIFAETAGYLEAPRNSAGDITLDHHAPDDWVGDELIHFVRDLTEKVSFDLCLVNYVYLSGVLTAMPSNLHKVIVSHDIFTDRNSRILESTNNRESFRFSLSAEDEAKCLARAGLVIAITDSDREYFVTQLKQPDVITIPYIPPIQHCPVLQYQPSMKPLRIGFIGSAHRPNADAIIQFIGCMRDTSRHELIIAGSVCVHLDHQDLPQNVFLLGNIDNIVNFYSQCHIIVNPDSLASGLKTKCVEAMSYGMPIICTEAASRGLEPSSRFHLASSAMDCAQLVMELLEDPDTLGRIREDSINLYNEFYTQHRQDSERVITQFFSDPRWL